MPDAEQLYEFVAKKAESDPDVRERLLEARRVAPFVDDVAWQALRQKFEAKKEERLLSIARRLVRGEDVDQREIDFQRGYFKGIEDFVNDPDKVIANLEAAARLAYSTATEDTYTP